MTELQRSAAQHTQQVIGIARALQRSFVFQDLQPAQLAPLAESCRRTGYAPGDHECFVGDAATELWVLEHGQLKEYLNSADGQETIVDIYGPGSVFGEPGLFVPERNRLVNVAAVKPSIVIGIPRAELLAFMQSHHPAMERMLEQLSAMARELVISASALAFDRIRDRLALKLVELAETNGAPDPRGTRITLKLSQGLLAAAIAATRPNVNRAIRELVVAGELTVNRDEYILTNPQRLRAAIAPERPIPSRHNRPRGPDHHPG